MVDYLTHMRSDSARFGELITATPGAARVPSCPDWSMADLAWHLTEVQYFWATIVAELLDSPDGVPELTRPSDDELPALFATQSARLVAALAAGDPDAACWTWDAKGKSVGWVLRRQAQEALIHRVDAELGAGAETVVDPSLAADGVDEILRVMMDASDIPEWSDFVPDGRIAVLAAIEGSTWAIALGRFSGTSPQTGTSYDDPSIRLLATPPDRATVSVTAPAPDLDLWLWGRRELDPATITGDASAAAAVRAAAVAVTQ
ncbi:MAG: maleylpyruvate isomerase family mycothiol-dependent enzyme [Acidimicrobiia bacterium]|nr:maleylpyruvate isomerase family mycothiol-dependent enzyme [Acidimicrobiia bacterium]